MTPGHSSFEQEKKQMSLTSTVSDSDIRRRVEQELEWDPRVDPERIAVKVNDGVVTLSGFVDSYGMKVAACDGVHHVSGVLDVVDEIEVQIRIQAKTDHDLAQAVRAALIWDVFVPDERIRSTVSDGWITLEGDVDRWQQREDAVRCVERLTGVRGVTNRIEVKAEAVDPTKIRKSIESALKRRAEREAGRIAVTVSDGVVTLKGTVDSWADRNALERLASHSPGVKDLINEIRVDPFA